MEETILVMMLIDEYRVYCKKEDNEIFFPCIHFPTTIISEEQAYIFFTKNTSLCFPRENFGLLLQTSNSNKVYYFAIIDLNKRNQVGKSYFEKRLGFVCLHDFPQIETNSLTEMVLERFYCWANFREINNLIKPNTKFSAFSNEGIKLCSKIIEELEFIYQNDRPDIIFKSKNGIGYIEQFNIDASKKTKYGSSEMKEKSIMVRRIDEKIKGTTESVISEEFFVQLSIENLLINLQSSFESHHNNMKKYTDNVESKFNQPVGVKGFLISDVTTLGFVVGNERLLLYRIKEFFEFCFKYDDIDFILFAANNIDAVYFFVKEDYNYLKDKGLFIDKNDKLVRFFDRLQVLAFQIPIKGV